MFNSTEAYRAFISSVSEAIEGRGFVKRLEKKFVRKTDLARFELVFLKSRETTAERLVFSMHAEVYLPDLDAIFRASSYDDSIPTASPYDFAKYLRSLRVDGVDSGFFDVRTMDEVGVAVDVALGCVEPAMAFFSNFQTQDGILAQLSDLCDSNESYTISTQVKYPAFLAAIGDLDRSRREFSALKTRFERNDADVFRITEYERIILNGIEKKVRIKN